MNNVPFGAHALFLAIEAVSMFVQCLIVKDVWLGWGNFKRNVSNYEETLMAMLIFFNPLSLSTL